MARHRFVTRLAATMTDKGYDGPQAFPIAASSGNRSASRESVLCVSGHLPRPQPPRCSSSAA